MSKGKRNSDFPKSNLDGQKFKGTLSDPNQHASIKKDNLKYCIVCFDML